MPRTKIRREITVEDATFTVQQEPAILVGGYRPEDLLPGEEPLEELEHLAAAVNANVRGRVVQFIKEIHQGHYIGSGKVQEVKRLVKKEGAEAVIFDHDLSSSQQRNLEQELGVKVLDRTDLILDIFASRAKTRLAKLQVSLAMAECRLPKLKRLWTHLEKQRGGIGMRSGPGEKQIETDRRKLLKQIHDLRQELNKMEDRKERMVAARGREHFLACLIGYTNAGKSTLMRALTGEDVLVKNALFVTLDTKTRRMALGQGQSLLLSDTVGFIRRLPHSLVASFHATLEEARQADLLLHVVDVSSPYAKEQMEAVEGVLKEIGADQRETLLVFNKVDQVPAQGQALIEFNVLKEQHPDAICVSALKKEGLERLKQAIIERAREQTEALKVGVHAGDGRTLSLLAGHFFEERREHDGDWIILEGRAPKRVIDKLKTLNGTVRLYQPLEEVPAGAW